MSAGLTDQQASSLREEGFVNLGVLLDRSQLLQIRNRIDELLSAEGLDAGAELVTSPHIRHPKEEGADRLADLVNKGAVFDQIWTHPLVLDAVGRVLGRFKLSSLNYRSAKPGQGGQKLHVDWAECVPAGDFRVCNSIWLLDDFSRENGATRLVPGSHLTGRLPETNVRDVWSTHPSEILLEAPAGTVVVFNAHLWHGGTTNQSTEARRAIHSYFCRIDQPQQLDQQRFLKLATKDRLSAGQLELLLGKA